MMKFRRRFQRAKALAPYLAQTVAEELGGEFDAVTYPTPMALLHENNLEGLRQMYDLPDMLVGFIGGFGTCYAKAV